MMPEVTVDGHPGARAAAPHAGGRLGAGLRRTSGAAAPPSGSASRSTSCRGSTSPTATTSRRASASPSGASAAAPPSASAGIQILLDGVPQTAPDGQSQLTNLDLDDVARTEVLRGSASSLYGNSSGGVVSFRPSVPAPRPASVSRPTSPAGSYGFLKANVLGTGITGPLSGTLSASLHQLGRLPPAQCQRLHHAGPRRRLGDHGAHQPRGPDPLHRSAVRAEPRGADLRRVPGQPGFRGRRSTSSGTPDKDVSQGQVALTLRHVTNGGAEYQAVAFGLWRNLLNGLAALAARRAVAAERRHLRDHRPHHRRAAADRHQPAGRQRARPPPQLRPRPPGACGTTAPTPASIGRRPRHPDPGPDRDGQRDRPLPAGHLEQPGRE